MSSAHNDHYYVLLMCYLLNVIIWLFIIRKTQDTFFNLQALSYLVWVEITSVFLKNSDCMTDYVYD